MFTKEQEKEILDFLEKEKTKNIELDNLKQKVLTLETEIKYFTDFVDIDYNNTMNSLLEKAKLFKIKHLAYDVNKIHASGDSIWDKMKKLDDLDGKWHDLSIYSIGNLTGNKHGEHYLFKFLIDAITNNLSLCNNFIYLSKMFIDSQQAKKISDAIQSNTKITSISLYSCYLSEDSFIYFLNSLEENKSVQKLDLNLVSKNLFGSYVDHISDKIAISIINLVKNNKHLKEITFHGIYGEISKDSNNLSNCKQTQLYNALLSNTNLIRFSGLTIYRGSVFHINESIINKHLQCNLEQSQKDSKEFNYISKIIINGKNKETNCNKKEFGSLSNDEMFNILRFIEPSYGEIDEVTNYLEINEQQVRRKFNIE